MIEIETGRYSKPQTPRGERFCSHCRDLGQMVVGDEFHFVFKCPKFASESEKLLKHCYFLYPNLSRLSQKELFIYLMSSEEEVIKKVAKFCSLLYQPERKE